MDASIITRSGFNAITFSEMTWWPEVTIGIFVSAASVLETSRPTSIDVAFNALKISATPFANTTTRETEKVDVVVNETDVTSFSEIE